MSLQSSKVAPYYPVILISLHFIIFCFVLIATPIDVFVHRKGAEYTNCASMFGWKECGVNGISSGFNCGIKSNMGAAAAFAIISIFITCFSFSALLLTMCNRFSRPPLILVLDGIACFTILISWACVAGVYNQGTCNTLLLRSIMVNYKYGASFGLMVTSWVLEVFAIFGLLLLPYNPVTPTSNLE